MDGDLLDAETVFFEHDGYVLGEISCQDAYESLSTKYGGDECLLNVEFNNYGDNLLSSCALTYCQNCAIVSDEISQNMAVDTEAAPGHETTAAKTTELLAPGISSGLPAPGLSASMPAPGLSEEVASLAAPKHAKSAQRRRRKRAEKAKRRHQNRI